MIEMKRLVGVLVAVLCILTFVGLGYAQTPGSVLVDRFHGQIPVDISGFRAALLSKGWQVNDSTGPITANTLNGCDVLLVLRPSMAFQDSEVEAIKSYVEAGGGLWMLEDLGNLDPPLSNTVAGEFGVAFNKDQVLNYMNGDFERPIIDLLQPHAVTNNVNSFLYDRGCSLNANFPAGVIGQASYSETTSGDYGDISVLAAAEHGNGRAVFIGDMTPLGSNYSSLSDDHKLMLENTVVWLSEPEGPGATVEPPTLEVEIDIRPWKTTNRIRLWSWWVVPVAVLSTDAFTAKDVDPATVLFAEAEPVRWVAADVNRDFNKDLLFFFRTRDLKLTEECTEATLTGTTFEGISFEATDKVKIVPESKRWKHYRKRWMKKIGWKRFRR